MQLLWGGFFSISPLNPPPPWVSPVPTTFSGVFVAFAYVVLILIAWSSSIHFFTYFTGSPLHFFLFTSSGRVHVVADFIFCKYSNYMCSLMATLCFEVLFFRLSLFLHWFYGCGWSSAADVGIQLGQGWVGLQAQRIIMPQSILVLFLIYRKMQLKVGSFQVLRAFFPKGDYRLL